MSTAETNYRLGAQAVTTFIHVSRSNASVFLKIPYNPFTLANIYYAVRTNWKPHKVDNLIHSIHSIAKTCPSSPRGESGESGTVFSWSLGPLTILALPSSPWHSVCVKWRICHQNTDTNKEWNVSRGSYGQGFLFFFLAALWFFRDSADFPSNLALVIHSMKLVLTKCLWIFGSHILMPKNERSTSVKARGYVKLFAIFS